MKRRVFDMLVMPWAFRVFDEQQAAQEGAQGVDTAADGGEATVTGGRVLTQADVDKAVAAALGRERAKAEKRTREAAEAARLEAMSESERTAERMKQMERQIAELTAEKSRAAMASTVRGMLSKAGVSGYDDGIVAALVVADDADATKSRVDSFVKSYTEAVNAGIRKSVAGRTPKATGGKPTMTKAEIMKIEDPLERQRAIKANLSLFTGRK